MLRPKQHLAPAKQQHFLKKKIQAKREQNSPSHLATAMSSHCFLLHVGQVQLLPGTTASLCDGNTMRAARAPPSHMSSTWQGVAGYPEKSVCRTQHCIAFSEAMAIHKMFCGSQQIPQSCRGLQTMENQLVCASPAGSIAYMPVQMRCAIIKAYVTNSKKSFLAQPVNCSTGPLPVWSSAAICPIIANIAMRPLLSS